MSTPRKFLICDSAEHADLVDQLILHKLRDDDDARGAAWSGVWVFPVAAGDVFGVTWDGPVSDLFGDPTNDQALVIVEEDPDPDGNSDWVPLPSPDVEARNPI